MAIPLVLLTAGAGCSGINASHSVSPLDFLLPGIGGLGQARPTTETGNLTNLSPDSLATAESPAPAE